MRTLKNLVHFRKSQGGFDITRDDEQFFMYCKCGQGFKLIRKGEQLYIFKESE